MRIYVWILFISPLESNNIVAMLTKAYNDYYIITESKLNKIEEIIVYIQAKMQKSIFILMYQKSVSWWNRRGLKFGCCSSISPLISILSQSAADPVLPGHKLREREMVSRDSSTKVLPLLWPTILTPSLTRIYHQSSYTKNCCTNTSYWIIQHEYVQSYDNLQATSWTNHSQFTEITTSPIIV